MLAQSANASREIGRTRDDNTPGLVLHDTRLDPQGPSYDIPSVDSEMGASLDGDSQAGQR